MRFGNVRDRRDRCYPLVGGLGAGVVDCGLDGVGFGTLGTVGAGGRGREGRGFAGGREPLWWAPEPPCRDVDLAL